MNITSFTMRNKHQINVQQMHKLLRKQSLLLDIISTVTVRSVREMHQKYNLVSQIWLFLSLILNNWKRKSYTFRLKCFSRMFLLNNTKNELQISSNEFSQKRGTRSSKMVTFGNYKLGTIAFPQKYNCSTFNK
jgi:hypothetical protein